MVRYKAVTEAKPSIDAISIPLNTLNVHVFVDLCNIISNNFRTRKGAVYHRALYLYI